MFGPLFIRLTLGTYFVAAGYLKIQNLPGFIAEVQKFNILPGNLSSLYGTLLPYVEMGAGTLMILGFWTTMASSLCGLMLVSFIIAMKLFPADNILFNKDVILLGACISLMYSGGGAFSIDGFRKASGSS